MAWHLWIGTMPLPEAMVNYCQLDNQEQSSVKFESNILIFLKIHLKYSLQNSAILLGPHYVKTTVCLSLLNKAQWNMYTYTSVNYAIIGSDNGL